MESLRKRVFKLVENDPQLSLKALLKQFPNDKFNSIKTYRDQCLTKIYGSLKYTPGNKKNISKKSKSYTKPRVKSNFHEQSEWVVDKDLEHFEGVELIKHFTEKAIKNKLLDMTNRLRAMTLYVQFYDKAGKIKEDASKESKEVIDKLRKMDNTGLIALLRKQHSNIPDSILSEGKSLGLGMERDNND